MNGLSLHIKRVVTEGQFDALPLGWQIKISHSFFFDDFLIMGMIDRFKLLSLFHIFTKFGRATSLIMNLLKSNILYGSSDLDDIAYIQRLFGVGANSLAGGMKYLEYHIKPCRYRINDWFWLVDRFYKKIMEWEFICLSLGGHITLTPKFIEPTYLCVV